MTSSIINKGHNNRFCLIRKDGSIEENPSIPGLSVSFHGNNARAVFHEPLPTFMNCVINMDSNSLFEIGGSMHKIKRLVVSRMKPGCTIKIGDNFSCESVEIPMHGESEKKIIIGDDCMFSHDISMYVSDFHGIYDINTKQPINDGGDIVIGNHVWIGAHVTILKNSAIGSNCIVGIHSLITKKFEEENCIIGGAPAHIIRKDVNWHRDNCQYLRKRGIL